MFSTTYFVKVHEHLATRDILTVLGYHIYVVRAEGKRKGSRKGGQIFVSAERQIIKAL